MSILAYPAPIVAVDVDQTVADLHGEWLRRHNERSGESLLPEDLDRWAIQEQVGEAWRDSLFPILSEPDLYRHVLPLHGARKAVLRLKAAGCRVFYASSCQSGTEAHKRAWLKRYGFMEDGKDFVSVSDKSLVRADYLVDDGIHNVEAFRGPAFLVSHPHNQSAIPTPNVTRVQDLMGAVNIILSLEEVSRLGKSVA